MANIRINGNTYRQLSENLWRDPFNNRLYNRSVMDILKRFPNGYPQGASFLSFSVTTSGSVDPTWTSDELQIVIPGLSAAGIEYRHTVYSSSVNWTQFTGITFGSINIAQFVSNLTSHISSTYSSIPGQYVQFFGTQPKQIMLNIYHPNNGSPQEIQEYLDHDVDITQGDAKGAYDAMVNMVVAAKTIYQSTQTKIFQYRYPFIPRYIYPLYDQNNNLLDAADWNSCSFCTSQQLNEYEVAKTDMRNLYRGRVVSYLQDSNADIMSAMVYPNVSEQWLSNNRGNDFVGKWIYETCYNMRISAEQFQKPVVAEVVYLMPDNVNGEFSINQGWNTQQIIDYFENSTISLVYSDSFMENYVFNQIKAAGVTNINFWGAWRYWWVLASQTIPNNQLGISVFDVCFMRKMINDLFILMGEQTIGFNDQNTWQSTQTKNRILSTAVQREVQLSNLFKQ